MSMRLAVVALVAVVTASTAHAQDDEAQEAFEAGEAAFDAGDVEAALAHFERAHELAPRDGILFNIAICRERLGHNRVASELFERVAQSADVSDQIRALARDAYARTRLTLGTIRFEGEPDGALVFVDGAERCALPCQLEVDEGSHEVSVRAGEERDERTVEVRRGESSALHVDLATEPEAPALDPEDDGPEPEPTGRGFPRWPTWVGTAFVVLGGAGTVGFGLRSLDLEQQYTAMPTASVRDEGIFTRVAANVSIAVMAVGALMILTDLLWPAGD